MSWKRLAEKILFKNPWHEYKQVDFETGDGTRGNYFFIDTPGSVYILARDAAGAFTMIHSYRFIPDEMSFEFPGGAVKYGQTPEAAAADELHEEVGLRAEKLVRLGTFRPCSGLLSEMCYIFFAEDLTEIGHAREATEEMSVVKKTAEEIDEMIQSGEITDGQTLGAWAIFKARAGYVKK